MRFFFLLVLILLFSFALAGKEKKSDRDAAKKKAQDDADQMKQRPFREVRDEQTAGSSTVCFIRFDEPFWFYLNLKV